MTAYLTYQSTAWKTGMGLGAIRHQNSSDS